MFSQRTGAQQSMSSTVMNSIIGYVTQTMTQKGLSSFLGGGDSGGAGGLKSALSGFRDMKRDHPLVQHGTAKCWYTRSKSELHNIHNIVLIC